MCLATSTADWFAATACKQEVSRTLIYARAEAAPVQGGAGGLLSPRSRYDRAGPGLLQAPSQAGSHSAFFVPRELVLTAKGPWAPSRYRDATQWYVRARERV